MGYTINDFDGPVVDLAGEGPGSLTAQSLQPRSLYIAAAADAHPDGIAPNIKLGGMSVSQSADVVSSPYRSSYLAPGYFYPGWWYGYWWGWNYWWLMGLEARILIGFTNESGTLEANFEGYGITDTALKVYGSNITVGDADTEAVDKVSAATSSLRAENSRYMDKAFMSVKKDDLVVAIGRDDSYNWQSAQVLFNSGPGVQELFAFNPQLTRKTLAVKIWRVQADGTLGVNYNYVSRERMLMKLTMNVALRTIVRPADPSPPSAGPNRLYFEIEIGRDATLKPTRPQWFNSLADANRYDAAWGKVAAFTRETTSMQQDALGRERAGAWKEVELWGVAPANKGDVNIDQAKFYDLQGLNARMLELEGRI